MKTLSELCIILICRTPFGKNIPLDIYKKIKGYKNKLSDVLPKNNRMELFQTDYSNIASIPFYYHHMERYWFRYPEVPPIRGRRSDPLFHLSRNVIETYMIDKIDIFKPHLHTFKGSLYIKKIVKRDGIHRVWIKRPYPGDIKYVCSSPYLDFPPSFMWLPHHDNLNPYFIRNNPYL